MSITSQGNFNQCIKCTVCTVYCPVAKATSDYPGPKQCGPDGERLRLKDPKYYDDVLKYCTNCKRCESACPSNVRIGDIIAVARGKYEKKAWNPKTVRDFVLSHTDFMGSLATPIAPVVNRVTSNKVVKKIMHNTLDVHDHKQLPKYSHGTFRSWYKSSVPEQSQFSRQISYFHGCYVNYNHPQLGKDFIKVMNSIGFGVQLLQGEKCCGVPLIANGFHSKAQKNAVFNINKMNHAIEQNSQAIIATSSTCCLTLQQEYPHVLQVDNSTVIKHIQFFSRFLLSQLMNGNAPKLKPLNKKVVYHTACHLECSGAAIFTIELLRSLPGLEVVVLDSECCGSAGTYGYKREHYDISMKIGKDLFEQIQTSDADLAISDCETCRWQIEENTQMECWHPISLIAQALAD